VRRTNELLAKAAVLSRKIAASPQIFDPPEYITNNQQLAFNFSILCAVIFGPNCRVAQR
jgi:hypothetical protein